jgi:dsRNA-specific ribonuclease
MPWCAPSNQESASAATISGATLAASGEEMRLDDMPKLSWSEMMDRHPSGHLVVGIVDGGSARQAANLVTKLLAGIALKGDFAVSPVEEAERSAVHTVFARKQDADQLAEAVGAGVVDRYPGWASQRLFKLDEGVRRAITNVLDLVPV